MSYTGKWDLTLAAPSGPIKFIMDATQDGSRLTGTGMTSSGDTAEVQDGKVDGANASWNTPIKKPVSVTLGFSATVDGDKMSGSAKIGMFGSVKFEGSRL